MENMVFWILFFFIILNGLLIILSKNPIHSILFLVLVFILTTILLILIGIEFISMLFLIIYIGAIIVLFLFVIMMLNIKIIQFKERFILYLPIGFFLGIIFIFEIFYLVNSNFLTWELTNKEIYLLNLNKKVFNNNFYFYNDYFDLFITFNNMEQLAILLYQKFVYFFFLSGVILLISMIGAIILTLNQKFLNKRQDAYKQTIKSFKNSIRYIKNKSYKKNTYM